MKKSLLTVCAIALLIMFLPAVGAAANSKIFIDNVDYRISRTDHVLAPVKLNALPLAAQNGAKGSYGGGIIFVAFDRTRLEYIGTKTGTMESARGNTIAWQSNDPDVANQNGEIRLAFADSTPDRSKSYGEGSFAPNSRDIVLYLEFAIRQKTIGDRIPVSITRAELAANADPAMPSLIGGATLDMGGANIYISVYNFVNSFDIEVYGAQNIAPMEKYPFIVDRSAANSFYIVASPSREGVVKARVIPDFKENGCSLIITCADPRVRINGNNIEMPANPDLKRADLSVRVKTPDGAADEYDKYSLSIIRGNITANVVKKNINTEVDADDLKGAIDAKDDALNGISTEIKLEITQNTPTAEDLTKVKARAGADTSLLFIDLSLLVTKKDASGAVLSEDEELNSTITPVTIRIEIPENMRGGSNYQIVRLHNGVAEIIPSRREGNFLVFETDKFSQYAISYKMPGGSSPGEPGAAKQPDVTPLPPVQPVEGKYPAYIKGYPDKTFKGENAVTRAETAAMIAALSEGFTRGTTYTSKFTDVRGDAWYAGPVGFMAAQRIIAGYPGGEFKPDSGITRAEFATVVAKFKKLDAGAGKALPFSDTTGHWAAGYLSAVYEKGYIAGYEDGAFRPDVRITRAEAVAIINRALGRIPDKAKINAALASRPAPFTDLSNTHWAYYDILEAALDY